MLSPMRGPAPGGWKPSHPIAAIAFVLAAAFPAAAAGTPAISSLSPNPLVGSYTRDIALTVKGSNFDNKPSKIVLTTNGGIYSTQMEMPASTVASITFVSSDELSLQLRGIAPLNSIWTITIVNQNGQRSSPFYFVVWDGFSAPPTLPSLPSQLLFDDFSYSSVAQMFGWGERNGPVWYAYSQNQTSSRIRLVSGALVLTQFQNSVGIGPAADPPSADTNPTVWTTGWYKDGTYAARIMFEVPATASAADHVVQTFWAQTTSTWRELERYAELDFEYQPSDFMGTATPASAGDGTPTMLLSAWNRFDNQPGQKQDYAIKRNLANSWVTCLLTVKSGEGTALSLFDEAGARIAQAWSPSTDFAPERESMMHAMFSVWAEKGNGPLHGDYRLSVDWFLHVPNDATLRLDDVTRIVSQLRAQDVVRRDTSVPLTLPVDTSAPIGQLDTPAQNATGITGAIAVTGWALDDVGVSKVTVYRGCLSFDDPRSCQLIAGQKLVFIGQATMLDGARPDVEQLYPKYPTSSRAGWGLLVLTSMLPNVVTQQPNGGQGKLALFAVATDSQNRQTILGRTVYDNVPTYITMDNDAIAKPFGAIDTPGQGETVNGTIANFGWALTPDTDTAAGTGDISIPADGSTVQVFIDGRPVGAVMLNQCRGTVGNPVPATLYCDDDVSNIFGVASPRAPNMPRSANSTRFRNLDRGRGPIGSYSFDTSQLADGLHTIAWSVTDSVKRSDGIGSRYFNVLNGTSTASSATEGASLADEEESSPPPSGCTDGVWARTGFSDAGPLQRIAPDDGGVYRVTLRQLDRLELTFDEYVANGYMVVDERLRSLPVGSHLTQRAFTWAPPAHYLGRYDLMFVGATEIIRIGVVLLPAQPGSAIAAAVDIPTDASRRSGPFTVAGWALDRQALIGSGIGAVHVWAFPVSPQQGDGPVFIGPAAINGIRSDVGQAFGTAFENTGWSITAGPLKPGEYELVAYFWALRTARFEDARVVRIRVP